MSIYPSLSFLFLFFFLLPAPSSAQRTFRSFNSSLSPWTPDQNLTLVSNNSVFAAGFLPLPSSSDQVSFSIWYHNISLSPKTVVWSVSSSLDRSSASLSIASNGDLRLASSPSAGNLWPGNATGTQNSTSLSLSDVGNLVYGSSWNSFDLPTNTFLPNQTISNGTKLTSNNGKFTFADAFNLTFNSTDKYWSPASALLKLDETGTLSTANGATLLSSDFGPTDKLRRLTLDDDGNLRIWSFDYTLNRWVVVWKALQELCKIHGSCGPNAICKYNDSMSTVCLCPAGYKPSSGGAKEGCEIKIPITEPANTKFVRLDYINYTGGSNNTQIQVANFTMCQSRCLSNPSCLGFMFKFDGSLYCVLQLNRMLFGYWSPGTQNAMYLRVDNRENEQSNFIGLTNLLETSCPIRISLPLPPDESNTTTRNIAIICTLFAAELIAGVFFFWAFLNKYIKYRDMARTLGLELLPAGGPKRFSYAELKAATNDFSNEIGRGGFGDVYRGELSDNRIIAVKCLKKVAGGDTEFWGEVTIIARMHHLNLVRLWGFCAEKGQRILVYEYVPNGSLDKYLFRREEHPGSGQENPKPILDWNIRYRIALGVARAIAYLHEECLEWVLHCDIKPENILLGDDFCPKISDFGLSKLRKKEDLVSMSRIRGTRGYMAPEWVKMDAITPKADVYSFGMVLLEIVSGVRNFEVQGSLMPSDEWYFPRWAFEKVFNEMNVEDILDRQIKHCYDSRAHFDMVNRMVKTAMWCLQDRPENRPSMGKVAKMLEGTVEIMEPTKPTIFFLSDE